MIRTAGRYGCLVQPVMCLDNKHYSDIPTVLPLSRSWTKQPYRTAVIIINVWNSLPVSVQNCDTLSLFKSRLKAHLFSSVYAS